MAAYSNVVLRIVVVVILSITMFISGRIYDRAAKIERIDEAALASRIKAQLLTDVRGEVEALVRDKVNAEMARLAAGRNGPDSGARLSHATGKSKALETLVQTIVRETYREHQLKDAELERYVASGDVSGEITTPAGTTTLFRLASSHAPMDRVSESKKRGQELTRSEEEVSAGASPERAQAIERTLQQRGSVLLPKKSLQIEPGFTYAHFSSNRINIQGFSILPVLVIGDISTQTVNRDVFIETMAVKYGLLDNLQLDFKAPFRQEFDRITNSSSSESTRSDMGMGDVELGISRQIGWEHGLMPDLIAAMSLKTPTGRAPYNQDIGLGTGHWAVRGSLIAAKSSDPAVIFGSLNYTYNFERSNIENYGSVKPGDSIGYSVGTAIALSYQTALSLSYDQSVSFPMSISGRTVVDSFLNSANMKFGLNWAMSEKQSVDFAVSMGLTKDSPDMSVEFRFPYRF